MPGNTCLSTSLPNASWQRIKPPRGPRRVLCVVVVTICACGTGEGWSPAATSPATCAMSTMKIAPTSSAITLSVAKSMMRAEALAARDLTYLVVVDAAGVLADTVMRGAEQRAREVHGRAVGQMAAVRQRQAEQGVAGLRHREIRGQVRLCPGVRLDVRVLRLEQGLGPIDGELLDFVHDLAAAVIPLPREPLRVLVGEGGAHGLEHRDRHEVLARDQLQPVLLTLHLAADQLEDGGVRLGERRAPIDHASIFATRRSWRPPSNAVSSHLRRISIPSSSLTNRDGSTSTLASLCLRASSAISGVHATAARTRRKRLATYAMPRPVPQVSTPRFTLPVLTACATGRP